MLLRVTGKNIDVGDALRNQVSGRLGATIGKYFDRGWSGQVIFEREGPGFSTECHVHLDSGIDLQSRGHAPDAYLSFDQAAERIEKRLRRYKRRLQDHHELSAEEPQTAASYVIAAPREEVDEERSTVDDNPVVIAENSVKIRRMTVGMAAMAVDLSEAPVIVFRNVANGRLNIVYRRSDGNIGWIDPAEAGEQEARG